MRRLSLFKLFVSDQEEARRFYVEKLGFEVAEDAQLGPYRWLLVRTPGSSGFAINLESARTEAERALVGKQAASQPLFSLSTDDCARDFAELTRRGVAFEGEPERMPWGIGVTMRDLHGNKIYLSQELAAHQGAGA